MDSDNHGHCVVHPLNSRYLGALYVRSFHIATQSEQITPAKSHTTVAYDLELNDLLVFEGWYTECFEMIAVGIVHLAAPS